MGEKTRALGFGRVRALACVFVSFSSAFALQAPASAQAGVDPDPELAASLLDKALSGKDGAFDVMEQFANCGGVYEAIGDYASNIEGGELMAENLWGLSRGATLAGSFLYIGHSSNPLDIANDIADGAKMKTSMTLSFEGMQSEEVQADLRLCSRMNGLQADIIKEIRKMR